MSSINQILNNALMESANENLEEARSISSVPSYMKNSRTGGFSGFENNAGKMTGSNITGVRSNETGIDPKHNTVSKAIKGVALGTAGLGAGGAIAYETEKNKDSKSSEAPKASEPATSANKSDPDKNILSQSEKAKPNFKWYDNLGSKTKAAWNDLPDNAKYGAGAAAALGAGLGAVALAKKLRNKKAAAKK